MTDRPPQVASLQVKTDGQAPSTHFDASEPLNITTSVALTWQVRRRKFNIKLLVSGKRL